MQISGNKALNYSDKDISTLELLWGKEDDGNSNQTEIPNTLERRELLSQLSGTPKAENSKYFEDKLIGLYEEDKIFELIEKDELINHQTNGENATDTILSIENNFLNIENSILNNTSEFELIDIVSEPKLYEEELLISKYIPSQENQNYHNGEYLLDNNSNLNSLNIINESLF